MHRILFENPATLFFATFLLVLFLLQRMRVTNFQRMRLLSSCFGGVAVFSYVAVNVMNAVRGGMLWHDEANILSISAAFLRGQAMYHAPNAAAYYSLFYGPVTYLVYMPFLAYASHPLVAIKLVLFVALTLELLLLFFTFRAWLSFAESLALLSVGIALLLAYPDALLGFRGDPWLLLCITTATILSVRGSNRSNWFIRALAIGVLLGLAVDVKATVIPVALIVIEVLRRRFGVKAAVMATLSGIAVAAGIFAVPHISLPNYAAWLLISSHQRFLRSTCINNFLVAAMLLSPVFFLYGRQTFRDRLRHQWPLLSVNCIALLVCILTGSKDGAGLWHLWPIMPLLLAGAAYELGHETHADKKQAKTMVIVLSLAIAGAVTSLYWGLADMNILRPLAATQWKANESSADAELKQIVSAPHRKNLSMGYGSDITEARTNLRFELPLARQDYFFDENEVIEGIKEGQTLPSNVANRILGCSDIWVIPHGEIPFSAMRANVLPATITPYIFPDFLRENFLATHAVYEQGSNYDLWDCTADAAKQ
jgi:hypothetical protein